MTSQTFRIHFPERGLARYPPSIAASRDESSYNAILTILPPYEVPSSRYFWKPMIISSRDEDATRAATMVKRYSGLRGKVYCKLIYKLRKPRKGTRASGRRCVPQNCGELAARGKSRERVRLSDWPCWTVPIWRFAELNRAYLNFQGFHLHYLRSYLWILSSWIFRSVIIRDYWWSFWKIFEIQALNSYYVYSESLFLVLFSPYC